MRFKYKGHEVEILKEVIGKGYTVVIDRRVFRREGTLDHLKRLAKRHIDSLS